MLYVPLIGAKYDGHDFLADAAAKGAAASLWQKDHPLPDTDCPLLLVDNVLKALQQLAHCYRSQLPVRVIGVTGSNGKTTTKDMIAALLGTTFKVHKTQANLNTEIGLPLTLLEMDEDTEIAVLEMGMRGRGQIDELTMIARPDVAVITVIGESHLELLGSREEIARAKTEILHGLKEGGLFVYNGDDPLIDQVLGEMPKPADLRVCRFGARSSSDIYPTGIMQEEDGTRFTVNVDASHSYYIPLLGRHNVLNAVAAIAVAEYMGVSTANQIRGLQHLKVTGMRLEKVVCANGLTVLNDAYNASPTSMRAALELLQELKGHPRKIAVLGDMLELGENEAALHEEIGRRLDPEKIHALFAFGPLSEHIVRAASAVYPKGTARAYREKAELIRDLAAFVRPGDLVLVKGSRGMALEEVVSSLQTIEIFGHSHSEIDRVPPNAGESETGE
jgi:UDP-N-acetylmuramoyl-tripeptide--D-alanyl-D-alanine ligase